jgi:hydroxymethylpyrimidine pyrophosphatase-like HAD family hydrolase
VCNGGATIFDEHGATLRALSIPLEIAQAIAALADQQGLPLLATIDELNYYRPGSHPAAHIAATGLDVAAMLPAINSPQSSLIMREFAEAPLRFVRHYRPDGSLADATITHAAATKESALAWLCHTWSIDPAAVLALGDAEADVGMLRLAGFGVAVANAQPDARAAADWVAPAAGQGGVAAAIQRYILSIA